MGIFAGRYRLNVTWLAPGDIPTTVDPSKPVTVAFSNPEHFPNGPENLQPDGNCDLEAVDQPVGTTGQITLTADADRSAGDRPLQILVDYVYEAAEAVGGTAGLTRL